MRPAGGETIEGTGGETIEGTGGETIEGTGGDTIEGTGGETIEGTGGGGPVCEGYITHPAYSTQLIIPCTVNTQVHINPGFVKLFT